MAAADYRFCDVCEKIWFADEDTLLSRKRRVESVEQRNNEREHIRSACR